MPVLKGLLPFQVWEQNLGVFDTELPLLPLLLTAVLEYEENIFCSLCKGHGVMPPAVNPVLSLTGTRQGSVSS